jgi:hypothetical protein
MSAAIGAIGREAIDSRGFEDPTGPDLNEVIKQGAANLSAYASRQQEIRDAESAAASASRQAAGVRQAYDFVAGARQNELSIRNLVRTTNLDRQAAAYQRSLNNDIRNERYRIGNEQARADFNSVGGTGIDLNAQVREQTAGFIDFRQTQRAEFGQFYNDLNTVERFAFDKGVELNETIIGFGQAIGNSAKTGIEVGKLFLDGPVDARISFGVVNKERNNLDAKVFVGTDIAGFSFKDDFLKSNIAPGKLPTQPLRQNVAQRFVVDTFGSDGLNPRVDFVQEFDLLKLDTSAATRKLGFLDSDTSVGLRRNLTSGENRPSVNIKFSLPDSLKKFTFGYTPNIALEFRGK